MASFAGGMVGLVYSLVNAAKRRKHSAPTGNAPPSKFRRLTRQTFEPLAKAAPELVGASLPQSRPSCTPPEPGADDDCDSDGASTSPATYRLSDSQPEPSRADSARGLLAREALYKYPAPSAEAACGAKRARAETEAGRARPGRRAINISERPGGWRYRKLPSGWSRGEPISAGAPGSGAI